MLGDSDNDDDNDDDDEDDDDDDGNDKDAKDAIQWRPRMLKCEIDLNSYFSFKMKMVRIVPILIMVTMISS